MKATLISLILILMACTCPDCPKCPPQKHDTIFVDVICYKCIDSLKILALAEVDAYRFKAIYQVDTMRANFLAWMDSMRRTRIWGNTIIKGDTLKRPCTVGFDSNGKPQILYK